MSRENQKYDPIGTFFFSLGATIGAISRKDTRDYLVSKGVSIEEIEAFEEAAKPLSASAYRAPKEGA